MTLTSCAPLERSLIHPDAEARLLYHALLCPFSRQIRLGLLEKNIPFRLREEKMWRPSDTLYTLNAAGTLPVLQDGAFVFVQTYPIIEYVEEASQNASLLGTKPAVRSEVRRLLDWFNQKFHTDVTVALLYEKILKRNMGQGGPDSRILKEGRTLIHDHLDYIGWLFDHRKWLAGDDFSWADIAASAHLSCLDYLGDVPWDKHPSAKDWYTRIKSRPHFRPFLQEVIVEAVPHPHYRLLDF
jgi:glutathione S-transferase